ncbi:MAG TPA: LAGLIDADG family homing endonuclease [Candidatus Saccharimonadales bacterium]|nr:LAGLIDADG family homing endonuclease [Candidatus Saccharimonadales bacterium]
MITAEYILGFTDGEGCFHVQIRTDHRIVLRYFITQRFDNQKILEEIQQFFGVGYVHLKMQEWGKEYRRSRNATYVFEVTKQDDIQNVIVPFFRKHPLKAVKQFSFEKFATVADLIKDRQDTRKLSEEELNLVWELKNSMNKLIASARPVPEIGSPGGNGNNLKISQSVKPTKSGVPEVSFLGSKAISAMGTKS